MGRCRAAGVGVQPGLGSCWVWGEDCSRPACPLRVKPGPHQHVCLPARAALAGVPPATWPHLPPQYSQGPASWPNTAGAALAWHGWPSTGVWGRSVNGLSHKPNASRVTGQTFASPSTSCFLMSVAVLEGPSLPSPESCCLCTPLSAPSRSQGPGGSGAGGGRRESLLRSREVAP